MAASFSRDPLFEVVLRQLPEQVVAGLRAAGLDDPAIWESYPFDSYGELVDSGATDGGTRCYSIADTVDPGGIDIGGISLSSPCFCYLCLPILSRLPSSSFLLPLLSASDTQIEVLYLVSWRKGSFSSGRRGKVRRITKGKSGVKSRRVGMSTDGHIVCESSERELELVGCVPQVGNSSPSGVELNVRFRQTGKAETRLGVSQFSEKSEHGSEPRFSDVCSEDYPAEQLSSSFQSPVKASGSISIRAAQSDPALLSSCCTGRLSKMVSFREDTRHSSHSLKRPY